MIISNSVSEEKNVLDLMHELSMIFDCVIDHSQKTNIKNEFINQNNRNFNQFGFILMKNLKMFSGIIIIFLLPVIIICIMKKLAKK